MALSNQCHVVSRGSTRSLSGCPSDFIHSFVHFLREMVQTLVDGRDPAPPSMYETHETLQHNSINQNKATIATISIFCCQISSRSCGILRLLLLLFIPRADQELVLSQQKVEAWQIRFPFQLQSTHIYWKTTLKTTEGIFKWWDLVSESLLKGFQGNH